jgi:hypothetical protein
VEGGGWRVRYATIRYQAPACFLMLFPFWRNDSATSRLAFGARKGNALAIIYASPRRRQLVVQSTSIEDLKIGTPHAFGSLLPVRHESNSQGHAIRVCDTSMRYAICDMRYAICDKREQNGEKGAKRPPPFAVLP